MKQGHNRTIFLTLLLFTIPGMAQSVSPSNDDAYFGQNAIKQDGNSPRYSETVPVTPTIRKGSSVFEGGDAMQSWIRQQGQKAPAEAQKRKEKVTVNESELHQAVGTDFSGPFQAKQVQKDGEYGQNTPSPEHRVVTETEVETSSSQVTVANLNTGLKSGDAIRALCEQIDALTKQHDVFAERLEQLQARTGEQSDVFSQGRQMVPHTETEQLGYAAGVMYAQIIQRMISEDRLVGVEYDARALRLGLTDAMTDRPLMMTQEAIENAQMVVSEASSKAREEIKERELRRAQAATEAFFREPGAKRDDTGYGYRIIADGDGVLLANDDVVDVVVEESLMDGTVVSDMESTGSRLRQAVKDFPPVFSSALKRLKKDGQIILIVPPELAYGSRGYPPSIPPGATLMYRIRVTDVVVNAGMTDSKIHSADKLTGQG